MTNDEKRTVLAVFSALLEKPYRELNTFIGSETIKEMQEMYSRLRYEDYLKRYGKSYDEMNEYDWIQINEMIEAENEAMSYIDDDAVTGSWDDEWF